MSDWREALIKPETSIRDAMQKIDDTALQIAVVVDENNRLLGTLTDGDIRRGMLKNISSQEVINILMAISLSIKMKVCGTCFLYLI